MRYFTSAVWALLCALGMLGQPPAYNSEVAKWRADHEAKIKSETGWLTLAGLFWLNEGKNTIGRGNGYAVGLTDNFKGDKFGEIEMLAGKAVLTVENGVETFSGGKPVSVLELVSDEEQKQTIVEVGTQTFYLIKRDGRYGIRLKDKQSAKLKDFAGLHWYPVDKTLRVNATLVPFDEPKEILVPNVLGGTFKYKSPGLLKFKLGGKEYSLQPVEDGDDPDKLLIIFRDLTSKTETYGAGRFLYADKPVNGNVILDFNKAENPPCAYTEFAKCPLPPLQNRLQVSIKAGEKRFGH